MRFSLLAIVLFAAAAGYGAPPSVDAPGLIYHNGKIITYAKSAPEGGISNEAKAGPEDYTVVDAVAVRGGRIVGVGSYADMKAQWPNFAGTDLKGKTLVPGFFDAHSHLMQVASVAVAVNLFPPPDGDVRSIADMTRKLLAYKRANPTATAIFGYGYDDSQLVDGESEHRHPTWKDLQEVSDTLPVVIMHQSGHHTVCNKVALDAFPIADGTKNPDGGTIYRDKDGHATGLLGESASTAMAQKYQPHLTKDSVVDAVNLYYLPQGFTTIQEGRAFRGDLALLEEAGSRYKADVLAYMDLLELDTLEHPEEIYAKISQIPLNPNDTPTYTPTYTNNFRIGGVKLSLDGSPQGRSAWATQSYLKAPEGKPDDYKGEGNIASETGLRSYLMQAYRHRWQVLVHANGDAAIDELIHSAWSAEERLVGPDRYHQNNGRRTVLIHGQFLRADQIITKNEYLRFKGIDLEGLDIFPSLFPMHTFYWGNWYREIIGDTRAEFISPTKAVQNKGMKFSIHTDAPVTGFPNSMRLLDSAVNRTTRPDQKGNTSVLGKDQRISPIVALKAMTLWPAYQHFEENNKGSIKVGKQADFVLLSQNPLTVAPENLVCVEILQTIRMGTVVHEKNQTVSDESFAADCAARRSH